MNKIKKILIGIICVVIMLPSMVWAANDEPLESGNVIVGSTDVKSCEAGQEKVKVNIPLINNERFEVRNVVVAPVQNESSDVYPFTTGKTNIYDGPKSIAQGKTKIFEFTFAVRNDVTTKNYPVKFDVTYTKNTGTAEAPVERDVHLTKTIFFKVTGSKVEPTGDPAPVETDLPVDEGDTGISDLGSDDGSMDVSDDGSVEDEESKTGTPRVIIDGFRTEPEVVNAGDTFKLILKVRNTSKKTAINNLELNLQGTSQSDDLSDSESDTSTAETSSDAFMPVKGSSTLYVDSIGVDKTEEISIDLTAKADLGQKPYTVSVAMKYEDGSANPFDSTSSISIPVKQKARLEVSAMAVDPAEIALEEEGSITFSINNLGRTKLYNVRARAEAESVTASDAFVGNIDSGSSGDVELLVTGMQETADEGEVTIIITYEDQDGNEDSYKTSCTLLVSSTMLGDEGVMLGEGLLAEDMEEEGNNLNIWLIHGIAVLVIAAVVVVIIIMMKRKHKKEEDFADEIFGSDTDE